MILSILKVVGIVLLVLIGLILITLLYNIFMPIRYKIKYENDDISSGSARVTTNLSFIRFILDYVDGKLSMRLSILWGMITIWEDSDESESDKERLGKNGAKEPSVGSWSDSWSEGETDASDDVRGYDFDFSKELSDEELDEILGEDATQSLAGKVEGGSDFSIDLDELSDANKREKLDSDEDESLGAKSGDDASKINAKKKREKTSKKKSDNIFTRINNFRKEFDFDLYKEVIKHLFGLTIRLIKRRAPKIKSAELTYSIADPSYTGYVLGLISLIPTVYEDGVGIYPDFESEDIYARGHISLFGKIYIFDALYILYKVYTHRECRKLFFDR